MSNNIVVLAKARKQCEADAWAAPELDPRDYMGQRYIVIGTFQGERKDGILAMIFVWASRCAGFGAPFTFATPATSTKFEPNRRCQKYKRPGVRVKEGAK